MEAFDTRTSYNKTHDTDVKYTGTSYPNLGIANGDKLSTVLKKIADSLDSFRALEERIESLEATLTIDSSKVKANSALYDLVDESASISHTLQDKPIEVSVKESSFPNQVEVAFNFSEAIDSLDSKYVPIGVETSIRTYGSSNKLLGSSGSRNGSLPVDKLAGPIIVNSRINLRSPEGDVVLTKSFYIPNLTPQEITGKFKVSGIATSEANSLFQKDFNEILASNLSKVVKDIAALEKKVTTIEKQA